MKSVFSLLATILLSAASVSAEAAPSEKKIRIGVPSALTGEAATYGLDVRDAITFANEKFGGDRYELIFEDDKCNGKDAVTVAKKFIEIDKVDFVVGNSCSGALLAAAPLYEKAKIPVIASCASSAKISEAGDYIFRTTPSDKLAAARLHQHIAKKHKRFGILSEETEYAQDMRSAFEEANQNENSIDLVVANYLAKSTDFKTILLSLRGKKIEGLFVNSQSEGSFAIIVKQLAEIRWDVPLYGAYWPGSQAFIDQAGERANGIEFVDTPSLDFLLNDEGKELSKEFHSKYEGIRSIESVFASSIEAFRVVDLAVRSEKDVLQFLNETQFTGIFGEYSFDSNGDIEGMPFMMKRVEDGKSVVLP